MIAIFAVFFLMAGALAAPLEGSDYIAACGDKFGITKEYHDAFKPLEDDWSQEIKCYAVCEAEHEGIYANGRFTEEYIAKQTTPADDGDEDDKIVAGILKECFEKATYENCEGAYSVLTCAMQSAIGTGIAKGFIEAIFESLLESLNEGSSE